MYLLKENIQKKYPKWKNDKITKLHLEHIREYPCTQNWDLLCVTFSLSEDFMEEFSIYLNWTFILLYQKISDVFILRMHQYINYPLLRYNNIEYTTFQSQLGMSLLIL